MILYKYLLCYFSRIGSMWIIFRCCMSDIILLLDAGAQRDYYVFRLFHPYLELDWINHLIYISSWTGQKCVTVAVLYVKQFLRY